MRASVLLFAVATLAGFHADAATYSFNCVTGKSAQNCATASQFSVDVKALNTSTVGFTFKNTATTASSILSLYFDQTSSIFKSGSIGALSPGVLYLRDFSNSSILPSFNSDYSYQAITSKAGVNSASDTATIKLGLSNSKTFNHVLNALNTGALKVGIQVGSFPTSGKEGFLLSPVPEPGTYALLLTFAVMALFWFSRRREQKL